MRHEFHLLRVGLRVLTPVAVGLVAIGWLAAGPAGAASAAIGIALVVANHTVAAASTGWSGVLRPSVVAVGYGTAFLRLAAVFVAFAFLSTIGWIHDSMLAIAFCTSLAVSLGAEGVSYARGTYVPSWRTR